MRSLRVLALLLVLSSALSTQHPALLCAQVITTVAGGQWVFRGDGGPATAAALGSVQGVAVDAAGNVLVADRDNHMVFRISSTGVLSILAGNGISGFSGENGEASSASLSAPYGVAVDSQGNVFISSERSGRVHRVSPTGKITTVAGGACCSLGDGGPATRAWLAQPKGIAIDAAGNLFIAESESHRVRKVTPSGIIMTVAGNGTRGDYGDGGPATMAMLRYPYGVATDVTGNLYVADRGNGRIRKVDTQGTITTITIRGVSCPDSTAVDMNGNIYVADEGKSQIYRASIDGVVTTIAGTGTRTFAGDDGPASRASVNCPMGVAVDSNGNIYIGDTNNNRVRKVDRSGIITTVGGNGLFKFAGDAHPAVDASLNGPSGLAIDASGNLYIADTVNNRIRIVGTNGTITTAAGTEIQGAAGDGGLANRAQLTFPEGVALDSAGNLYIADTWNGRIRKVIPDGTIGTLVWRIGSLLTSVAVDQAGNVYFADYNHHGVSKISPSGVVTRVAGDGYMDSGGTGRFSGDGGAATAASLNFPQGLALDRAGNIFIADEWNNRVRKITTDGIITTVAGGGGPATGDGGPATRAWLSSPMSVEVDWAGNLYTFERDTNRVRKVSPAGIITTVAGTGSLGFSGDGGPAANASLNFSGIYVSGGLAIDGIGNLFVADTGNDRIRKVLAAPPSFSVNPTSAKMSAVSGSPAVGAQQIAISGGVDGLTWAARATTESGGNWLSAAPATGATPGTTVINVNVANLAAGTYRGAITVQAPLAAPPVQTVTVELTVTPAPKPQLVVEPGSLIFEALAGGDAPGPQTLRVTNGGEGTLDWTAKVEALGGGSWLSLGSSSGAVSATSSANVPISISLAGLRPGIHSTLITIESQRAQQTQTLEATLLLSQTSKRLVVSQSGLSFTGIERRGTAVRQTVAVFNTGQGTMDWTASASTLSGGNWLSVTPASGRSDAAALTPALVEVAVNFSGLREGQYSGLIRVEAPGSRDSPQYVTVDATVLPAGSQLGTQVRPTGLIFTAVAGSSSPSSQLLRMTTPRSEGQEARSGILTFDGGDWIEILPRNLVVSADDPRSIVVQPSLGSKPPGAYRGQLTFLFDDGNTQVVNILFLVVRPGGTAAAESPGAPGELTPTGYSLQPAASSCTPQRLHAVHRTLSNNFSAPVGWSTPIEVQVADDCGNAVTNATVVASFTNGDAPLMLASQKDGTYAATWRPGNAAKQATVTVRAALSPLQPTELSATGEVPDSAGAPALFGGGIVSGASFAKGASLAPGSIISVFGRRMAQGLNNASSLPLARSLGGASLKIGDIDAPLFFSSDGQINAQIPFELTPGTRPQALLKARLTGGTETVAVPETITIVPARPGIFATTQDGKGQGVIMDTANRLVDAANPAKVGDVVVVYCTGLGATNPAVRSGEAAPTSPLAKVVTPVTVTIGGQPATVQFAGLTPGYAGLYQVNVQIPSGVTPGSAVPLVISQDSIPSNAVTLALR
jgi:uncharacterized protein (TIGR03437 family)